MSMAMLIPIFTPTNSNGNINGNCFGFTISMAMSIPIFFKLLAMAISIAIVVAIQYQWQYQYQFFSKSIPMSMAISIVSIVLEQYQWSINQLLLKPINTNCNVNCSNGALSIVNGNINTSKMSIPMVRQYYCSCLVCHDLKVRIFQLKILALKRHKITKLRSLL